MASYNFPSDVTPQERAQFKAAQSGYNMPDNVTEAEVDEFLASLPDREPAKQTRLQWLTKIPSLSEAKASLQSGVDAVSKGLTLGASDEIEAGIRAGASKLFGLSDKPFDETYSDRLGDVRARYARGRELHPVTSVINEVGSSIALPGAATANFVKAGTGATNRVVRAAGAGAIGGASSGYLGAEGDIGSRKDAALGGAIFGTGFGGIFGGAGAALPTVVGMGRGVFKLPGDASDQAKERLVRAFERDDLNVNRVNQDIAQRPTGQREVMNTADIAGRNTRRLLAAVEAKPGKASERVFSDLTDRVLEQPVRLSDSIKRIVSDPGEFHKTGKEVAARKKADANDLFRQAWAADPVPTPVLGSLTQSDLFKEGYQYARKLEGRRVGVDPDAVRMPKWPKGGPKEMTFRQLDAVKGAVDRLIQERRNPVTGSLKGRGANDLQAFKDALVPRLDELNPDYKTARSVYAGEAALEDAMWTGRSFARGDPEVLRDRYVKMLPSEQDHFKLGLAYELQKSSRGKVMTGVFNNPETFTRLKAVLGKDYDEFVSAIEAEKTISRTRNEGIAGSRTAPLMEAGDDLLQPVAPDDLGRVVEGALHGRPSAFLLPAVRMAARSRSAGLSEDALSEIAGTLLERNPARREERFRELMAPRKRPVEHRISDAFMNEVVPRAGVAVGTSNQEEDR